MSEKKLYFKLYDGGEAMGIVMELSGCVAWIQGSDNKDEEEYILVPVWMTEEEYNALDEENI